MKHLFLTASVLLAALPLSAAVVIVSTSVNTAVPDGASTGLFSQVNVADLGTVNSVTVGLSLGAASGSQAYLGDLYAYLQHGSGISILLNRPGKRTGASFGYDDNQSLAVTFGDGGSDIHNYRTVLNGFENTSLTGTLTGAWAPDGRTTDPALVLASDLGSAFLSGFTGGGSEGDWRLFVADLSGGSVHQLNSWTLTLDITPVPEPATYTVITGLALAGFALFRRYRGRR